VLAAERAVTAQLLGDLGALAIALGGHAVAHFAGLLLRQLRGRLLVLGAVQFAFQVPALFQPAEGGAAIGRQFDRSLQGSDGLLQGRLGTAILQMAARTPAMTAMTAMTLDALSGGRALLGLGVSGPQVVEGWHGQPFGKPLGRTREYVSIVRAILARQKPVTPPVKTPPKAPAKTGTFTVSMTPFTTGVTGTIAFDPDPKNCPVCKLIRLVQIVRVFEKPGVDYPFPGAEAPREQVKTAADATKGVKANYFIDHLAGKCSKGNKCSLYYRDHAPNSTKSQDGSNDGATAAGHFAQAVKIQDGHWFTEPPPWYYPVRQSLGAALLAAGRPAEAEAVYREDLKQNRENGWSLFGLAQSLRAQGKTAEADQVQARFTQAWARADVTLTASRF
jgi:hypothetical protein